MAILIVGPVYERLKQILEHFIEEHAWKVLKLAIQADHGHLLLRANPYMLPTDLARKLKERSSHLLREALPQLKRMPSIWTRSSFDSTAASVSAFAFLIENSVPVD